jgi:hypothetical protein
VLDPLTYADLIREMTRMAGVVRALPIEQALERNRQLRAEEDRRYGDRPTETSMFLERESRVLVCVATFQMLLKTFGIDHQ